MSLMPLVKGEDRYQMSSPDAPRPRQTDISFGCHVYEILAWGGSSSEGEGGNGDWEEGEEWGGWCEDERFSALDGVE